LTDAGHLIPLLPGGIELENEEGLWRVPSKVIGEDLHDSLHKADAEPLEPSPLFGKLDEYEASVVASQRAVSRIFF
jgi:hypothetical protein